jgi:hypothetical protein
VGLELRAGGFDGGELVDDPSSHRVDLDARLGDLAWTGRGRHRR